MAELSDEELMQYADKVLDAEAAQRIEGILARHPELQAKVAMFERTRQPVQQAFASVFEAPVPEALVDRIRQMPGPSSAPVRSNAIANLAEGRQRRIGQRAAVQGARSWRPVAMAASLCLMIGAAGGWVANGARSGGVPAVASGIFAEGAMKQALDFAASGSVAAAGGVMPVASFRAKDQSFCRQYQSSTPAAGVTEGIACRTATGAWEIRYHGEQARRGGASPSLAPAEAGAGRPVLVMLEKLIDGQLFEADEEKRFLDNRWKQ